MDDACALPLRDFNLSRYFIRTAARLAPPPPADPREARVAAETALASLPLEIALPAGKPLNSPLCVFLASEVQQFNRALAAVRAQLLRHDPAIHEDLVRGRTPHGWLAAVDQAAPESLLKFLSYVADKTFMLKVWLKSIEHPAPIDARLISNLRGLFDAYTLEAALARNVPVDRLALSWTVARERETRRDCLVLTNCWLMGAGYDEQAEACVEAARPFAPLPQLVCEVKMAGQIQRKCPLPLFKSVPAREFALHSDYERVDGEVENFIRYIELDSTVPDWSNIANAAAVICHLAERFT
jgi:hypothetical protein